MGQSARFFVSFPRLLSYTLKMCVANLPARHLRSRRAPVGLEPAVNALLSRFHQFCSLCQKAFPSFALSDHFGVANGGLRSYANLLYLGALWLSADVAELADALDSKSSTRESVWVRPPPSAPFFLLR